MAKTTKRIVIEKILGIVLFLIIVFAANLMIPYINYELFTTIVKFFNENLLIIIFIGVLTLIADLMFSQVFPFNIFAPIITAIVALLTVNIIIKTLNLVGILIDVDIFNILDNFKYPIYLAVIVLTLVVGYVQLFNEFLDKMDAKNDEEKKRQMQMNTQPQYVPENISWKEVNTEYERAFYSFAYSLKSFFDSKVKKR